MYEQFRRQQIPRARSPIISIGRSVGRGRGKVSFNAVVGRIIEAEHIEAFAFLFDKKTHSVALKKVDPDDRDAFVIAKPTRDPLTSMSISAPAFFDSVGWVSKARVHIEVAWNTELQALEGVLPPSNIGQRCGPLRPAPKALKTAAVQ